VRDNPRAIEIVFAEKNSNKAIVYECVNQDNQCEIIAKLTFLLVSSQYVTKSIEKLREASLNKAWRWDDATRKYDGRRRYATLR
jgi:hypothetical protein